MKTELLELNEDERDCLQELMNVAYGSATAAISQIIDAFATLKIPMIKIVQPNELKNYLSDQLHIKDSQFIATQLIDGDISGESLFMIDTSSATNLTYEFNKAEEPIQTLSDNDISEVVLEITNILSSATIGKLSEQLNTSVSFSPPTLQKIESLDALDNRFINNYQQIIIISTELEFEVQKIRGELLILTKDESLVWIQGALNRILEEF